MFPFCNFLNLWIKPEVVFLILFMVAFVHFVCTYKEKTKEISSVQGWIWQNFSSSSYKQTLVTFVLFPGSISMF